MDRYKGKLKDVDGYRGKSKDVNGYRRRTGMDIGGKSKWMDIKES